MSEVYIRKCKCGGEYPSYEPFDDSLCSDCLNKRIAELEAKLSNQILDVLSERHRQDAKWGEQNHDPFTYLTILGEEYGEFCQAALETRFGGKHGGFVNMRNEAVQTAAVALAIVECLDRGKWSWGNHPAEDNDE